MWLRRDLRIRDNPALLSALEDGPMTAPSSSNPRSGPAPVPHRGWPWIVDHAEERREPLERFRAARASVTAAEA
jgi:hypothetical protein